MRSACTMASVAVDDLAKLLECPVCLKITTVPGRLCETGHPMCGSCASDLHSCPRCESPILAGYSSFLQKMAMIVPRPCDYSLLGCKVKDVPYVLEDHKKFCEFHPFKCCVSLSQLTECDFVGLWPEHWQHVIKYHSEWARQQSRLEDVRINIRPGINTCYYLLAFGKVFCCLITFDSDSSLMCVKIVQHLREGEEEVYPWTLKINDEDIEGYCLTLNGTATHVLNDSEDGSRKVPFGWLFGVHAESTKNVAQTFAEKLNGMITKILNDSKDGSWRVPFRWLFWLHAESPKNVAQASAKKTNGMTAQILNDLEDGSWEVPFGWLFELHAESTKNVAQTSAEKLNGMTTKTLNDSKDGSWKVPFGWLFGIHAKSTRSVAQTYAEKLYSCMLCIHPANVDQNTQVTSQITPSDSALLQNLMKLSECPVCWETARPPVILCQLGHILCKACTSQVMACPICRCQLLESELLFVKKVMQIFPRPCCYSDLGCPVTDSGENLERHERMCPFITLQCPIYTMKLGECDWCGLWPEYWPHIADSHTECARDLEGVDHVSVTLYRAKDSYFCLRAHGEVFDCLFSPSSEREMFHAYVWSRSPASSVFYWQLKFSVKNVKGGTLLLSDLTVPRIARNLDDSEKLPFVILKKFKQMSGEEEYYPCQLSVYSNTQV